MITQLDRVGLMVGDGDRSAAFYTEYLGMELVTRRSSDELNPNVGRVFDVPGAILRNTIRLAKGDFYLVLFEMAPRARARALPVNHPGSLTLSLASNDLEADFDRLRASGAAVVAPPSPVGGLTMGHATDPDGVVVGFAEHLPAGVDALATITVGNAAASAAFFSTFGMSPCHELDRTDDEHEVVGMRLGIVAFQFDEYRRTAATGSVSPMNNVGAVQCDFFTDDIDADFERVHATGATVISPPVRTRRGAAGTGFDANGVMWELSTDDGRPKTYEYHRTVYSPQ